MLSQAKLQETRPRLIKLSHSFSLTCTVIGYFITHLGLDLTAPRGVPELVSYILVVVVVALVIFHPSRANSSSLMKHLKTNPSWNYTLGSLRTLPCIVVKEMFWGHFCVRTGTKFLPELLMTRRAQSIDNKAKDSNSEQTWWKNWGCYSSLFSHIVLDWLKQNIIAANVCVQSSSYEIGHTYQNLCIYKCIRLCSHVCHWCIRCDNLLI